MSASATQGGHNKELILRVCVIRRTASLSRQEAPLSPADRATPRAVNEGGRSLASVSSNLRRSNEVDNGVRDVTKNEKSAKFRAWYKAPERSSLIFGDTRLS